MAEPGLPLLIQALVNALSQSTGAAGSVRLVETHISWVILCGQFAYKIKKPVNYGFLNFSTLELRHRLCLEELRLNRRLAPDLYLAVVSINGNPENPVIGGDGAVLEYAVKLRRFDESGLGDRLLADGRLTSDLIDGMAACLADFHGKADRTSADSRHGGADAVLAAAEYNFDHLLRVARQRAMPTPSANSGKLDKLTRLQSLQDWTRAEFIRLRGTFSLRKDTGHVCECHGDLHTGNLVLSGGRLLPFDCIEFNEDLRWIDCISEVAFLFMDLEVRGAARLAWRLLNRYLTLTGDYDGLPVFGFYRVYRALVRAKVAVLAWEQLHPDADGWEPLQQHCLAYLDYAERASTMAAPRLLLAHGFSGSGKSHAFARLAESLPGIRLSSDVERKRLARQTQCQPDGLYNEPMTAATYARLTRHAENLLKAGFTVLLDATFLSADRRGDCWRMAQSLGVDWRIVDFQLPKGVLAERLQQRGARGESDATLDVLEWQMAHADPLNAMEQAHAIRVDGDCPDVADWVASRLCLGRDNAQG